MSQIVQMTIVKIHDWSAVKALKFQIREILIMKKEYILPSKIVKFKIRDQGVYMAEQ